MSTKRFICITFICGMILCACSNLKHVKEVDKWDCTVECVEASTPDSYIITYSNEKIVLSSGVLTIQNQNNFDIKVYFCSSDTVGGEAYDIAAGGVTVLYQLDKEAEYSVGVHADVEEGTEIKVMAYDGEVSEPF